MEDRKQDAGVFRLTIRYKDGSTWCHYYRGRLGRLNAGDRLRREAATGTATNEARPGFVYGCIHALATTWAEKPESPRDCDQVGGPIMERTK